MISKCCVGFASLPVVCDELMIVLGNLVCSSFVISVFMFIVLKALLISSATVIVCAGWGGGHLVEPLFYSFV